MLDGLIHALVESDNEAADDLLLEALRLGNEQEKTVALKALLTRGTLRGMSGLIEQFEGLPDALRLQILREIRRIQPALGEYARHADTSRRLQAMRLIALGHQGKLSYLLLDNLRESDAVLGKAAVDALVALARWVAIETRTLQKGVPMGPSNATGDASQTYHAILDQRPDIEQAVARALDLHRGPYSQELLRAALLLADCPKSRTLAILETTRHGGQNLMIRRLQQAPASEHIEAFLLAASHGGLRSHFGVIFAHITEAPVLDALLRKTHWLKDHQLQLCMRQVMRGAWWTEADLLQDIARRPAVEAAKIGHWLAASGMHEVVQDERLARLLVRAHDDVGARLRLFRLAAQRPTGASVQLLQGMVHDRDERLMRMAVREIIRRRPLDYENVLLPLMTNAPDSVRRVIARAIGHVGFEQYWQRFDRLDKSTRKQAGKAMLKLLPDTPQRLSRRLLAGPLEQRLKAMQVTLELNLADALRDVLLRLCQDTNSKLRSKAVLVLGELTSVPADVFLDRVLNDADARVRANAIEVLEAKQKVQYLPLLMERARATNNRERANAIKALHSMRMGLATEQLYQMLRDDRPEHRISALWALRQVGWRDLVLEVARLAKDDGNLRVRRYAMGVLRGVAEMMKTA